MAKSGEYIIVTGTEGVLELEKKVNSLMEKGWLPQGGPREDVVFPGQRAWIQAMVKLNA